MVWPCIVDVPVPTVKLLSRWSDVIVNDEVSLSCETVGPDWSFSWFRDGVPLPSNIPFSDPRRARLTISSISKSLQGRYTCRAQHNTRRVSSGQSQPITITVHDAPTPTLSKNPTLNKMYVGENVTFTCAVPLSSGWTYKWYKNDALIGQTNPTLSVRLKLSDAGEYSCQGLRGNGAETLTSDKMAQAVDDVPAPFVKLHSQWSDVFVNEAVALRCETGSTEWRFSWFRNGQPLSGDASLDITEQGSSLQIASASKGHMGDYSCKAHHKTRDVQSEPSQPLHVKVYENTPKPTLTKTPKYDSLYVGERVHFACSVDVASGWTFKWFKSNREIKGSDSSLSVQLGPFDGGEYSCTGTRGGRTNTESSDKITLTVLEIPVPQVKPLTPWLDVFPSETVELGCGDFSAAQDWTYEWQKNDRSVSWDQATLTISSASASHGGQYKCQATLKGRPPVITSFSTGLTLTVYDEKPQPVLVQDPDYSTLFPNEPMSFHCHINVSNGWEFVWYKNKEPLQSKQVTYKVPSPAATQSGSYTCKARRGRTHSFSTNLSQAKEVEIRADAPEPVLSQTPQAEKVYKGEQVTFECKQSVSSDWEYHWIKNGQIIPFVSDVYIMNATQPQQEVYKCKAKRKKTTFETESQPKVIHISEIPIPSVKNMTPWLDVFPTETVRLGCGVQTGASDWIYKWSKDGQRISHEGESDESVKTERNEDGSVLTIHSSVSHKGKYSCMAQLKARRRVKSTYSPAIGLQVYDAKPRVELIHYPEFNTFYTDDSVSFFCGVNVSSGWEYLWYKNNHERASGPNHTIRHVLTSDGAEYKCTAKRGRGDAVFHTHSQSVTIEVKERPSVAILLLTGWSEVFSTDSLVLKCEAKDSEDEDWEFRWFKGGERINQSLSEKHTITPQNDPDQSQYKCQGVRSTARPSYTKHSEPLKTNNLLLKRRVLLSISGCLVFGLCAVFIGCIVLKVLRKPGDNQEKTEEVDLFLTRAELSKHAPNPLTEYITDDDLKNIADEEDENGTLSCDSAFLPITSNEDEAATSESNNTTGNGEMVSFKQ
ncbi:hemicentin-1 [Eucyclogobius newberryi]|uniref:hemicentin-1 n=1 Tax=Eucyclogobius newberryi TaxID=166745 RepID=UPI003B59A4F3